MKDQPKHSWWIAPLIWLGLALLLGMLEMQTFTPKDPKIMRVYFDSPELDAVVNQQGEIESGAGRAFLYVYVNEQITPDGFAKDEQLNRFASHIGDYVLDTYFTNSGFITDPTLVEYVESNETLSAFLLEQRFIQGQWDGIPTFLDALAQSYIVRDGQIKTTAQVIDGVQLTDMDFLTWVSSEPTLANYLDGEGQILPGQLPDFLNAIETHYLTLQATIDNPELLQIILATSQFEEVIDESGIVSAQHDTQFIELFFSTFFVSTSDGGEAVQVDPRLIDFIRDDASLTNLVNETGSIRQSLFDTFQERWLDTYFIYKPTIDNATFLTIIQQSPALREDVEFKYAILPDAVQAYTAGLLAESLVAESDAQTLLQLLFNEWLSSGEYLQSAEVQRVILNNYADLAFVRGQLDPNRFDDFLEALTEVFIDEQAQLIDPTLLALVGGNPDFTELIDADGQISNLKDFLSAFRRAFFDRSGYIQDDTLFRFIQTAESLTSFIDPRGRIESDDIPAFRQAFFTQLVDETGFVYQANIDYLLDHYADAFLQIRVVVHDPNLLTLLRQNPVFAEGVRSSGRVEFRDANAQIRPAQSQIFLDTLVAEYLGADGEIADRQFLDYIRADHDFDGLVDEQGRIPSTEQPRFLEIFSDKVLTEETMLTSAPLMRFSTIFIEENKRIAAEEIAPRLWWLSIEGDSKMFFDIRPLQPTLNGEAIPLVWILLSLACIEFGLGYYRQYRDDKVMRPSVRAIGSFIIFWSFFGHEPFWQYILAEIFPRQSSILSTQGTIIQFTADHLVLVILSSLVTVPTGLIIGILVTRASFREFLPLITNIANFGQTMPTLAILALMVPIIGQGFKPAIIALVLYGLLPVIRNTIAGIDGVDPAIIDAARGMGMTPTQILFQIELAVASRVIMAGIRTSVVINIGTATLGAFVGAGGLGIPISSGINAFNRALIFLGAIPAALLAVLVDYILGQIEYIVTPKGLQIEG